MVPLGKGTERFRRGNGRVPWGIEGNYTKRPDELACARSTSTICRFTTAVASRVNYKLNDKLTLKLLAGEWDSISRSR